MRYANCLGIVLAATAAGVVAAEPTAAFRRLDKNADGKIVRSELPPALRRNFERVDTNGDGEISPEEDTAFRSRGTRAQTTRPPQDPRSQLPTGYTLKRDVAYVPEGHERHVLDLYLPPKSVTPPPLVVFIHGGGWRQGNKDRTPLKPLLDAGFAGAAINYRLSQHATFPAQIHDCKAAIRWLRSHASEYGFNGNAIGVWGTSAGGHLVALLGTSGGVSEVDENLSTSGGSSRVQAVCDYFGPTDLLRMDEMAGDKGAFPHNGPDSPEARLLGGPIQEKTALAKQANPLTYVTADDPPFYIVHGDEDRLVPLGQSEILNDALKSAGVQTKLRIVRGAGHGQFRDSEIVQSVVDFFIESLGRPE